jgi:hypothetical protein
MGGYSASNRSWAKDPVYVNAIETKEKIRIFRCFISIAKVNLEFWKNNEEA